MTLSDRLRRTGCAPETGEVVAADRMSKIVQGIGIVSGAVLRRQQKRSLVDAPKTQHWKINEIFPRIAKVTTAEGGSEPGGQHGNPQDKDPSEENAKEGCKKPPHDHRRDEEDDGGDGPTFGGGGLGRANLRSGAQNQPSPNVKKRNGTKTNTGSGGSTSRGKRKADSIEPVLESRPGTAVAPHGADETVLKASESSSSLGNGQDSAETVFETSGAPNSGPAKQTMTNQNSKGGEQKREIVLDLTKVAEDENGGTKVVISNRTTFHPFRNYLDGAPIQSQHATLSDLVSESLNRLFRHDVSIDLLIDICNSMLDRVDLNTLQDGVAGICFKEIIPTLRHRCSIHMSLLLWFLACFSDACGIKREFEDAKPLFDHETELERSPVTMGDKIGDVVITGGTLMDYVRVFDKRNPTLRPIKKILGRAGSDDRVVLFLQ